MSSSAGAEGSSQLPRGAAGRGDRSPVNLEFLAKMRCSSRDDAAAPWPSPTRSWDIATHDDQRLGVLGWAWGHRGRGGHARPAALHAGARVIGFELTGQLPSGATATDLVLSHHGKSSAKRRREQVRRVLRPGYRDHEGGDGRWWPICRPSMAPRMGFFPIDEQTLAYLRQTGEPTRRLNWSSVTPRTAAFLLGRLAADAASAPLYTKVLCFDLGTVEPSMAGPKRPRTACRWPALSSRSSRP